MYDSGWSTLWSTCVSMTIAPHAVQPICDGATAPSPIQLVVEWNLHLARVKFTAQQNELRASELAHHSQWELLGDPLSWEDGTGHPVIFFCPVETGLLSGSPWVGKTFGGAESDPGLGDMLCADFSPRIQVRNRLSQR